MYMYCIYSIETNNCVDLIYSGRETVGAIKKKKYSQIRFGEKYIENRNAKIIMR